jgi:hypothetical protein
VPRRHDDDTRSHPCSPVPHDRVVLSGSPPDPGGVAPENTVPADLWTALDGYDVGHGFGDACPGCEREHDPGDRLVVTVERRSAAADWNVPSVVCSDCGRRSFPEEERRPDVDQVLVSVDLVATPMALVLDAESARVLERAPATDG